MATCFKPPAIRTLVNSTPPQANSTRSPTGQPSSTLDEGSIYIFPVPSSIPASPGSSSVFSAPSDFAENFTESSGRSRNSSVSSRLTETTRSRTSSLNRLSFVGEDTEAVYSPVGDVGPEPEVEAWDWMEGASDDLPIEDVSWAFEAGGGTRDSERWRLVRRSSVSRREPDSIPNAVHPPLPSHRLRTQSSSSGISSARSSRHTPHPRVRIPLLSFIASLICVDPDDPVLRLLTHSTSDSLLFPGQINLLDSPESVLSPENPLANAFHTIGTTEAPQTHGLLRLLTVESSSKSVRDGLAVACDAQTPFSFPSLSSISNLCRFVGDAWVSGGQAWRELSGSAEPSPR